ncbi:alpha/beta fold hydrolase [Plantibacter sp. VKM Ac-2876]|uniref:alpha/beta fold hydrolase n=1 Tax=Plantibacter sp. VKM Ac-2876 TaxID=2783826 RepID=UPI00188BB50E|nr:alpha/beta hydrolase [Plantibacter sp. VKM Ac-2876]MBF4564756.1 alpha/beta hydrolase [Plantibacter sp. VKM Ac-2876]
MPVNSSRPTPADDPSVITADATALGLGRVTVDTDIGPVTVRAGREAGGPATILLHGAAGSWTTWSPLLRADDERGAVVDDVIAVDLPGWGESALPTAEPVTVGDLSAAVATVARSLGYRSWRVVGHSLGGFVALDLAVREPEATIRVDLVSPTGIGVVEAIRQPVGGGARLPWFAGMLLGMRVLQALGERGPGLVRMLNRIGLLAPLMSPLFGRRRDLDRSVVDALAADVRPASFLLAARAAGAYDLHVWRGVRCPVRCMMGDRDVFIGPDDAAVLVALVPDLRLRTLPATGHFAAVEHPEAVLELVTSE